MSSWCCRYGLIEDYGATYFHEALARYITQLNHASDPIPLRSQTLDVLAQDVHFPFRTLPPRWTMYMPDHNAIQGRVCGLAVQILLW
ncbi:hypothetical protein BDR03DRAFT_1015122 [Suillus americanus]|nr:hypothetical protein BDR03DRAFT_1015122 [Suillus americanus]